MATPAAPKTCVHCHAAFPSSNKLFQHLRQSDCTDKALQEGLRLDSAKPKKNIILFAYHVLSEEQRDGPSGAVPAATHAEKREENRRAVEGRLMDALLAQRGVASEEGSNGSRPRSFTMASSTQSQAKHENVAAVADVAAFVSHGELETEGFLAQLNASLPQEVRALAHVTAITQDFHADLSCFQKQFDYALPVEVLFPTLEGDAELEIDLSQWRRRCEERESSGDCTEQRTWLAFKRLKKVLKIFEGRHSWHNYTPGALPSRKTTFNVSRFFRQGSEVVGGARFIVISAVSEVFLFHQFRTMIAMAVAVLRGWLPPEFVQRVRSPTEFITLPTAPKFPMYLAECRYPWYTAQHLQPLNWRKVGQDMPHPGFDTQGVLDGVTAWRGQVLQRIAARCARDNPWDKWLGQLEAECHRLRQHGQAQVPRGPRWDGVPPVYAQTLALLRQADRSGLWPDNSVGRAKVIAEGAVVGGTFTLGRMPKDMEQPKANTLFPELWASCRFLERALEPDRPPSSTIAVNRHAQFLPHKDSGAGAGQSTSLIVGLGEYEGGETVVEGEPHDIRYHPLEFNGWLQRHWTLPFTGERFSLVWFTPLGCGDE